MTQKPNTICVLPWIHMHTFPNGDVVPCCATEVGSKPLGNLHQNSMAEIWNDKAYRELRQAMINGEEVITCKVCYDFERAGGHSLRQKSNDDFAHHMKLIEKTKSDGSLDEFKLHYVDFRFSNFCNLKCRMCCAELSSGLARDLQIMKGEKPGDIVISGFKDANDFAKQITPHLQFIEEIYFAGGEPLLMEEHYAFLKLLVFSGVSKNVKLRYNTNFTVLGKKREELFSMWEKFKHVEVCASLDASGERAEYIRQGTRWNKVLENFDALMKGFPQVDFKISTTVGVLNLFHVPEFRKQWLDSGKIQVHQFYTTNIYSPYYYSAQILPPKYKEKAQRLYDDLATEAKEANAPQWIIENFRSISSYMMAVDQQQHLRDFFEQIDRFDSFYKKSFEQTFPEYSNLRSFI